MWTNFRLPRYTVGVGRIMSDRTHDHFHRASMGFRVRLAGRWGFIVIDRRAYR